MAKRIVCGLALAMIATVPLLAKVVTNATNGNIQVFTAPGLVRLTPGGATSLGFSGKGKHIISFSAECSIAGTHTGAWGSIQIIVDGVVVSPTDGDDAFCTDWNGNNLNDQFVVAHYRVVTGNLAEGAHSVSVEADSAGTATNIRLDDTSLVVEK